MREPQQDYPLLHIPFDGLLGNDGHRGGYGTLLREGDSLLVYSEPSIGEFVQLPKQNTAQPSQPITFIDSIPISNSSQTALTITETASYSIALNTEHVSSIADAFDSTDSIRFTDVSSESITGTAFEPEHIEIIESIDQVQTEESSPSRPVSNPDLSPQPQIPGSFTVALVLAISAIAFMEFFAFRWGRERMNKEKK